MKIVIKVKGMMSSLGARDVNREYFIMIFF